MITSVTSAAGKAIPLKKCKPITYCKFCKAEGQKVRCTVMTKYQPPYNMRDWYKHYSCDDCIHKIEDPDPRGVYDRPIESTGNPATSVRKTCSGDDHYTEADYQTWLRL